jgi:hypothetical protein
MRTVTCSINSSALAVLERLSMYRKRSRQGTTSRSGHRSPRKISLQVRSCSMSISGTLDRTKARTVRAVTAGATVQTDQRKGKCERAVLYTLTIVPSRHIREASCRTTCVFLALLLSYFAPNPTFQTPDRRCCVGALVKRRLGPSICMS